MAPGRGTSKDRRGQTARLPVHPDPSLAGDDGLDVPRPHVATERLDWIIYLAATLVILVSLLVQWGEKNGVTLTGRTPPVGVVHTRPLQLDINNADWPEVMQLPGIGESRARDIVADRTANGPFASIDDLTRVRGIGPVTLGKVRESLRIEADRAMASTDRPSHAAAVESGDARP